MLITQMLLRVASRVRTDQREQTQLQVFPDLQVITVLVIQLSQYLPILDILQVATVTCNKSLDLQAAFQMKLKSLSAQFDLQDMNALLRQPLFHPCAEKELTKKKTST